MVKRIEGERGFCGEVSHINVTPSSQRSRDIKRQGDFIPLYNPHLQRQILHLHMATLCNYFLIFSTIPHSLDWFQEQD